jgi:hypothetical protein
MCGKRARWCPGYARDCKIPALSLHETGETGTGQPESGHKFGVTRTT